LLVFGPIFAPLLAGALFVALASLLFLALGHAPLELLKLMIDGAFGGGYAVSETLVRMAPILLCAVATALPARVGLVTVGAEGQLGTGAIAATAFVLFAGARLGPLTIPVMLISGAAGGAGVGALAGWLRARIDVNETISTLLLNYIPPLLVDYLVYGPWKDPQSLGWPATVTFPDAARLPTYFGTRVHAGLVVGIAVVVVAHVLLSGTRWGLSLDLLRGSPSLAARARLSFPRAAVVVMAAGGACAGLAGIAQASAIEGRLQSGVGAGAGYAGFLVAWLGRGRLLRLVPLSLLVAALAGSGDNLQLFADLPSATTTALEGLLFVSALVVEGLVRGRGAVGLAVVR
jgi:simple sugar transport system permease protein